MKVLQEIWNDLPVKSDKGDVHSYLSVYEEILAPYRTTAKNILEIGLFNGASLLMWEKYFEGKVYGIDCDEQPHGGMADLRPMIASGQHRIVIGDATSDIEKYFAGLMFDVVIEDANHDIEQQLAIYKALYYHLSYGSIYIIEDVQDIDVTGGIFKSLGGEIIDRRKIKNRYDDVLIILK